MATLEDVKYEDWQISLTTPGEIVQGVEDVHQCIQIILGTQKGSNALRPDFGVDVLSYIDKPVVEAIANLKKEIITQIAAWEPRATIESIEATPTDEGVFSIKFVVNCKIADKVIQNQIIYG